ncbi:peptide-N-glycosidase [Chloropicon primus]|uniref:Peptide-N-glycosidase n=1 Tax=Chloropicon primus TaxID=1764295 RepID=A0A5B8MC02_9CHLO|nr:peptide-N-glycosidase [Chloropicon primus]UPQ97172.1 peptide-N-glycosidase [Chloropicon primus]|eukprot:QDZ17957.1 peptide-N-glycosidase [Chloropicon primus]
MGGVGLALAWAVSWVAVCSGLDPGDPAPHFSVRTTRGVFSYDGPLGAPIIVYAYFDKLDGYSEALFSSSSSVERFLSLDSEPAEYLFLCGDCETASEASRVAQLMESAFHEGGGLSEGGGSWGDRLHFAVESHIVITNLLADWNSTRSLVRVEDDESGETATLKRIDGHFGWLPHVPSDGTSFTAEHARSSLCHKPSAGLQSPDKAEALIIPWANECSFATILGNAQDLGAKLAVLYPRDPTKPLEEVSCSGEECDIAVSIPAMMIPWTRSLEQHGGRLTLTFDQERAPGRSFAISSTGMLAEVGWPVWPWLASLGWAAQYQLYESRLAQSVSEGDVVEIPIFKGNETLDGDLEASILLPSNLLQGDQLGLDLTLWCTGSRDWECPEWDHVIQAFVCCSRPCQACPSLIWSEHNTTGTEVAKAKDCGPEIGRWMTPFRRRGGRWFTDITNLKGAFSAGECRVTMQTVTWASSGSHAWRPQLSLRIRSEQGREGGDREASLKETLTPLFGTKQFDKNYNKRSPFHFTSPVNLVSAHIRALITGHGSDENQCAEFCAGIELFFIVNGQKFTKEFSLAGTQLGCTEQVANGSLPNEHGTWFYGRNGWCDGQDVAPWILDITSVLMPSGENNTIEYVGLYQGADPNPQSSPGQILMSSQLVLETISERPHR